MPPNFSHLTERMCGLVTLLCHLKCDHNRNFKIVNTNQFQFSSSRILDMGKQSNPNIHKLIFRISGHFCTQRLLFWRLKSLTKVKCESSLRSSKLVKNTQHTEPNEEGDLNRIKRHCKSTDGLERPLDTVRNCKNDFTYGATCEF